ncbi:MAG: T9SS type A sorting domain-containing protein [Chitinophagales bacterium]
MNLNFNKPILLVLFVASAFAIKAQTVTLSGEITTYRVLSNDTIYLLEGFVYVKDGGILDIEEGTLIKGDKASKGSLIVTRDGIILAAGTASQPIIFTSNEPEGSRAAGDWGGILILGNAPINSPDVNTSDPGNQAIIEGGVDNADGDGQYGGDDASDSRGGLQYVRIEYPGIAFLPGNEINGLTCGGCGNGTILDHIMVSNSGDDAFEFFGGTVSASYLVANATLDDDFDTDLGYSGNLQFLVALRNPDAADVSGSNSFESDNDGSGSSSTPITSGVVSNATIIGPIQDAGDVINANYKRGAQLRRNTQLNLHNSVIIGYPSGLMVDGSACEGNADAGTIKVKNTILAGHTNNFEVASGSTWDITSWFNNVDYANTTYVTADEIMLNNPYNYSNPDLRPMAGSPVLDAASFSDADLSGMMTTTYVGAFDGVVNWTSCWTNWDPQNTDYSTPISGSTTATEALFSYSVDTTLTASFANNSLGADSYFWDFGVSAIDTDTSSLPNPSYTYPAEGSYEVKLIAIGCSTDTLSTSIIIDSIGVTIDETMVLSSITYFPNPVKDVLHINLSLTQSSEIGLKISDMSGRIISESSPVYFTEGNKTLSVNLSEFQSGMYFVNISADQFHIKTLKVFLNK